MADVVFSLPVSPNHGRLCLRSHSLCRVNVEFFSRLEPTVQYAVVSSELRELFPFYQYVDCMKCEYILYSIERERESARVIPCFDASF